jgi:O-acetyl-ADP-ribose deacetylase (regulator of RNase III)
VRCALNGFARTAKTKISKVKVVLGDITKLKVDAIVNAANVSLRGGGGVDGAIHRAAGLGLLEEVIEKYPDGIVVGEAVATFGHKLKAMYVIHTVGPRYYLEGVDHAKLLADAYRNSMRVANDLGCRSIAFPSISTGVYGYPIAEAAEIAVRTVREEISAGNELQEIVFCCFSQEDADCYKELLAN